MSTLIYTVPNSRRGSREEPQRNSSVSSTTSIKNGVKYVARKIQEHERQSQLAWEAFYGVPQTPSQSSRNHSTASASSTSSTGSVKKTWNSVKEAAKAHHRASNEAYAEFYGGRKASQ